MGAFFDRMSVVLSLCTVARASRAADLDARQAKLRDRATPRAGRAPKEQSAMRHRAVLWLAGLMLLGAGTLHAKTVRLVYTDAQGTVIAKTDVQGTILGRYDYRPYGGPVSGGLPQGPGYTGHVNDPEAELVYMQARYYDPMTGRLLSADPIGIDIGSVFNFNRYDYASNNPVTNMDPTGLCAVIVGQTGCPTQDPSATSSNQNPPPPPPPPSPSPVPPPKDVTPLPQVTVTANSQNIGAVPPIFRAPGGRPLFRKSLIRTIVRRVDDFASKQIVKKASFKALTISKEGFLEPAPFAFGFYIMLHSPDLGGCGNNGRCADEFPASSINGSRHEHE